MCVCVCVCVYTHAHYFIPVLTSSGSQLRDMFSKESSGPSFQEPAEIDGNPRWTIVHVYRKDQSSQADGSGTDTPLSVGKECKVYTEGVYLPSSALLKDLRSAFIKSEQLEDEDKFFLFATGPDGQDTYGVDDESIFTLKDFEPAMEEPRTFYITAVTDTSVYVGVNVGVDVGWMWGGCGVDVGWMWG